MLGRPAWAADPVSPSADAKAAEALFRSGREALRRGENEIACARFTESHRLAPNEAGPLLNLSQCEAAQLHILSAIEYAERALSVLPESDSRGPLAEDALRALRVRVAHLEITVPVGARSISVDTRAMEVPADRRVEVKVDPGLHKLAVHAPQRADRATVVKLEEGQSQSVVLELGGLLLTASPAPLVEPPKSRTKQTLGYVIGAAGLAFVGIGAASGIVTLDRAATVHDHCDANGACDATGLAAGREAKTFGTVSTFTVGAGVVALAAGITLIVLGQPKKSPR